MTRRTKTFAILASFVSLVALFIMWPRMTLSNDALLKLIAEDTGLEITADYEVLEFKSNDSVIDPIWVAKLGISEAALSKLEKSMSSKADVKAHFDGGMAAVVGWWKPTNIVFSKRYEASAQVFVHVVVSKELNGLNVFIEHDVF